MTSPDRVTPAAVGRGERESIRTLIAGMRKLQGGLETHWVEEVAHVEGWNAALDALLAALPPDAGGEDGERRRANEEFAAQQYRKECDLMHQYVRMHNVGGAAGYGKNVFGLVRDECDRLRAARRSATERSGGGT